MRTSLILCPLLLLACSVEPDQSSRILSPEQVAELQGTYALRQTFANISELPVVGQSRTVGISDRIAKLVESDEGLQFIEQSCRLTVESDSPLKVSFDDQNIQALPTTTSRVEIGNDEQGLFIRRPQQIELIGVDLVEPGSALPLSDRDPQIVDADQDGKPGITAKADAGFLKGELYMIQRSLTAYTAYKRDSDYFRGPLRDETEQVIVGTSSFLLNAAKGKLALSPDPDPEASYVELIKISEDATCDDLIDLFPPR